MIDQHFLDLTRAVALSMVDQAAKPLPRPVKVDTDIRLVSSGTNGKVSDV